MYSDIFCKVYNEFGWNYFPEAFGEELLAWLRENGITVKTSLDLACGSGVLCEILHRQGVKAAGMDLSAGMIAVAKERNPEIEYEVADMVTFCPDRYFDLVTCTGDALNHILDLSDVSQVFRNVHGYLREGGYFIFDILNEKEVPSSEPFDLVFSEEVTAQFSVTQDLSGAIHLKTVVFENGAQQFEEDITEIVHDPDVVCDLLSQSGFQVVQCAHHLLKNNSGQAATWYIIAKKES